MRFEDFLIWKGPQGVQKTFFLVSFSRLSVCLAHFFFASAFFFHLFLSESFSLAPQLKMSSSGGKDFDTDGRRRDTEKKTKATTTTTKDALERALSRHERKYVSSSSEGRFAEDLGICLLSFFLSAVQRTDSIQSLLFVKRKTEKTRREKSPN